MTQRIGSPSCPGILEVITDWPEGKDFGMSPEEEVTRAEEAPPYNKLTEDEKPYALFTDGSCRIVGQASKVEGCCMESYMLEKLVVKVCHVDAHVPKSRATEEHQNNQQVDQAAKIEVAQVDLDWQQRIESDNGTHFWNNLIDTWAKEHGIEWVYHIPYHAPDSGKIERQRTHFEDC
ncbi:hypothetical protein GRJ2_003393300 [Grus japonensis]|uniref:Integrase catalytic domain-containing protein n=1 Tax=Grus japonensis TaxID=30415 RepID=A0ABC9YH77_GRUJA